VAARVRPVTSTAGRAAEDAQRRSGRGPALQHANAQPSNSMTSSRDQATAPHFRCAPRCRSWRFRRRLRRRQTSCIHQSNNQHTSHAPSSHTLHQCVCLQIVALEEADVAGMDEPHVMRLASSLLPDRWLSTPRRVRFSLRSAQQSLIS